MLFGVLLLASGVVCEVSVWHVLGGVESTTSGGEGGVLQASLSVFEGTSEDRGALWGRRVERKSENCESLSASMGKKYSRVVQNGTGQMNLSK